MFSRTSPSCNRHPNPQATTAKRSRSCCPPRCATILMYSPRRTHMTPHNRDSKQNEWQTYSSQSGCQSVVMQTLEQRRMQLAAHCGSEPLVQEQRSPKIQSDTRMSPEPPAPHGSAPTPQALQQLEARDVWEAPAHNVICTDDKNTVTHNKQTSRTSMIGADA